MKKWILAALVLLGGCSTEPATPSAPPSSPSPSPSAPPSPYLCGCCFGMHMLPGAKCEECGGTTAFQEHQLCDACSAKLVQCAHCRKAR